MSGKSKSIDGEERESSTEKTDDQNYSCRRRRVKEWKRIEVAGRAIDGDH